MFVCMHMIEREDIYCMLIGDIWNCCVCVVECAIFMIIGVFPTAGLHVYVHSSLILHLQSNFGLFEVVPDCKKGEGKGGKMETTLSAPSQSGRSGRLVAKLSFGPLTPRTFTSSSACSARVSQCLTGPLKTAKK